MVANNHGHGDLSLFAREPADYADGDQKLVALFAQDLQAKLVARNLRL